MHSRDEQELRDSLSVAIQPSSNHRQLVLHSRRDEPFIYLGDTAWESFHRLDDREAEFYLRNRAEKGFNSVMVVILAEHGGLDYPNREGHFPFLPSKKSTYKSYVPDIYPPNPEYFYFVDRIVHMAAKFGITISIVPTWGRYVNGGFYGGPIVFDEKNAYAFGKFLGQRYPFHPFILGGDSVRYWNPEARFKNEIGGRAADITPIDFGKVTISMANGLLDGEAAAIRMMSKELQALAEGYKTFITYHSAQVWLPQAPEALASAQFPEVDWLSMDCVQSGHYDSLWESTKLLNGNGALNHGMNPNEEGEGDMKLWKGSSSYVPVRKMYNVLDKHGNPRPVIDLEPHYDATHHFFTYSKPLWTGDDIRCGAWQGIFAGACGYTYGVNSIWQMHNDLSTTHPPIAPPTTAYTNWYLELDLPGAYYASTLRKVLLSLPDIESRVPDSTFINAPQKDPFEEVGDSIVSGMKSTSWAMVHLPYGGEVDINVGKALPASGNNLHCKYRAWWVDPKTGAKTFIEESETRPVSRKFVSPTEGSLATDWLLLLEVFKRDL